MSVRDYLGDKEKKKKVRCHHESKESYSPSGAQYTRGMGKFHGRRRFERYDRARRSVPSLCSTQAFLLCFFIHPWVSKITTKIVKEECCTQPAPTCGDWRIEFSTLVNIRLTSCIHSAVPFVLKMRVYELGPSPPPLSSNQKSCSLWSA